MISSNGVIMMMIIMIIGWESIAVTCWAGSTITRWEGSKSTRCDSGTTSNPSSCCVASDSPAAR